MTFTFAESLHVDDGVYQLDEYPLAPYVKARPDWPRFPKRPWNTNGYMATWAIEGGTLYLTQLHAPGDDPLAQLFPHISGPVPALWFDGILRAVRGRRRHVVYSPRALHDDELYLEVKSGTVTREWLLDLRTVPDQTDDELRLALPRFLWPARLRDRTGGDDDAADGAL
jgi:hypothetical protein